MSTEILVPELSESVSEATVGRWLKREGDPVREGEALVELETDKVDLEIGAEVAGVLAQIDRNQGDKVAAGDRLGRIDESGTKQTETGPGERSSAKVEEGRKKEEKETEAPAVATTARKETREKSGVPAEARTPPPATEKSRRAGWEQPPAPHPQPPAAPARERPEERQPLSARRRTIARRLLEAQKSTATLTTFNEVDMSAVVALRETYKEEFRRRHGVGLGIVSFFVKSSVAALKAFPRINAELEDEELVLKRYYDIGIAVADPKGLVVPVIRDCDRLSFVEIEKSIDELATRARDGSLGIEELRGGTFTVSNGGVFGSLWSTPILNPPQVAILGLHRIERRPVAVEERVEIRPMMYVALSYDHRVVDGEDAVQFLGRVKELVERPETLLFEA